MKNIRNSNQSGFSLIEMVLVVAIISLVCALAFSRLLGGNDGGGGERVIADAAVRITERRDEAVRLNGNLARTSLEEQTAPLVVVDFAGANAGASLIIDGVDADGDHRDDDSGDLLTHLENNDWIYSYRNDALKLPTGWSVLTTNRVARVKLIGNGKNGQGALVTRIGFDAAGRAYGFERDEWQRFPIGTEPSGSADTSPFWAVYFVNSTETPNRQTRVRSMVAIAVYPSGHTEKFRFDGENWLGFRSRNLDGSAGL